MSEEPRYGPLTDGSYDAIVVDVEPLDQGCTLELTILAGEHKGAVISVVAHDYTGDPLDALGIPATLTVTNGEPHLELEKNIA